MKTDAVYGPTPASTPTSAAASSASAAASPAHAVSSVGIGVGLVGLSLPRLQTGAVYGSTPTSTPTSLYATATPFGGSVSPASCTSPTKRGRRLLNTAGATLVAVGRRRPLGSVGESGLIDTAEKEIMTVVLPPLSPTLEELALAKIAAFWDCAPESVTVADINPRWLALRYRLYMLRQNLYHFRFRYTQASTKGRASMISFLQWCDACKRAVDGSIDYFSGRDIREAMREVERAYEKARDAHNECLFLAESLFMGLSSVFPKVYSTGGPFGESHLFPQDGLALGYLQMPHCIECSKSEGKRAVHPHFNVPKILVFEDVCPYCETSFLELLCKGNVYVARDNRVKYDPAEQFKFLSELARKLDQAEQALFSIFMPTT